MRRVISILLILILFFSFSPYTRAANGSFYLSPSSASYTVGNTFSIAVRVNTGGISINAAQGTLVFSPDKLLVVGISKTGSIFSLWTSEPTYSNSSGTISFGGGVPNPGFTGASGKIITITFRARVSGTGSVNWSSGAVLANDGKGTNILATMGGGTYTLGATIISPLPEPAAPTGTPAKPDVSSSTHPDESKWYANSRVEFSWPLAEGITGVSIYFNEKPSSNPGPLSDGLFNSKIYENVKDGIWYLHLKLRNKYGWGPIRHFRVQVDTAPPLSFIVEIKEGEETDNPQPTLIFEAKDEVSGISHYKIRINGSGSLAVLFGDSALETVEEVLAGPFKMPSRSPGKHTMVVEAFDKAGNSTAAVGEVNILAIETSKIIEYDKRLSLDENLIVKGTSLPGVIIKIYIQKEGLELILGQTKADEDGNWLYIHDKFMSKGAYKIYAIAVDERGAQSYPSNEVTVLVSLPPLFVIWGVVIDYITVIIVLIALIGMMIFGGYWGWYRFRLLRKKLIKETEEVSKVLTRAFDLLEQDVEEQLGKLKKIKDQRRLKQEEEKIEKELKKDLNTAEKYIRREVRDVEKKLNQKKED